uniref:Uncharacterized protein n=1 Tax=Triticum urartu TaxID=4572 RepID=A0A8R7PJM1_TRIUA
MLAQFLKIGCMHSLVITAILDAFFEDLGLLKVMIDRPTYSGCGIACTLGVCSFVCAAFDRFPACRFFFSAKKCILLIVPS